MTTYHFPRGLLFFHISIFGSPRWGAIFSMSDQSTSKVALRGMGATDKLEYLSAFHMSCKLDEVDMFSESLVPNGHVIHT